MNFKPSRAPCSPDSDIPGFKPYIPNTKSYHPTETIPSCIRPIHEDRRLTAGRKAIIILVLPIITILSACDLYVLRVLNDDNVQGAAWVLVPTRIDNMETSAFRRKEIQHKD